MSEMPDYSNIDREHLEAKLWNCQETYSNLKESHDQLQAELEDERSLRYKTQNETSKRVFELKAENDALGELLSPLVDVELERDNLKAENEELRELFVYFFGENYEELAKGEQDA